MDLVKRFCGRVWGLGYEGYPYLDFGKHGGLYHQCHALRSDCIVTESVGHLSLACWICRIIFQTLTLTLVPQNLPHSKTLRMVGNRLCKFRTCRRDIPSLRELRCRAAGMPVCISTYSELSIALIPSGIELLQLCHSLLSSWDKPRGQITDTHVTTS